MSSEKEPTKILLVVGTRPEVIKMAPVYIELRKNTNFGVRLCVTGQHSSLLELALKDFGLTPDYSLEIMEHGQTLAQLTSKGILSLEKVLEQEQPGVVLVHGDTTTTLAASMAAFYAQIPLGHVEAGLRTHNLSAPFPEELNRQIVSRIATWNFAPTELARENLLEEGVEPRSIYVTGNTVIDSLIEILNSGTNESLELIDIRSGSPLTPYLKQFVMVTLHRRENLGAALHEILDGVRRLATTNPSIEFVFPVHPNTAVRDSAERALRNIRNVLLIEPLSYQSFTQLLSVCLFVISDSGGIQEEAVALGRRILVARETTERSEGLASGLIQLVGASSQLVFECGQKLLSEPGLNTNVGVAQNPFGDGKAAERISSVLASALKS
jgi:UDP-N-acetylglucosamine 2-epimerase